MPIETFRGPDFASLLAEAQTMIGEDAVVLAARRVTDGPAAFELVAADPTSAPAAAAHRAGTRVRPLSPLGPEPAAPPPGTVPATAPRGAAPFVIALIGPTGAGKTTTIAKLANHPRVFGGDAVGLLCLDTYRIGAVEQSRAYAELSRTPLEVVYERSALPRALRRLSGCDVVLVDTAGRGPRGQADTAATRAMLEVIRPDETHLTLPAGLQSRHARRVVADYRSWGVTHLLPTKLDEFPDDGTLFDVAAACGLPIRWIADGQEVPADLQAASLDPRYARAPTSEPEVGVAAAVALAGAV